MDREEALLVLKDMLEESDDTARMLPDRRLEMLLDETDGDVRRAAYLGAMLKARCTGVTLPDGVTLQSNRDYWLTVARVYRGNYTVLAEVGIPEGFQVASRPRRSNQGFERRAEQAKKAEEAEE